MRLSASVGPAASRRPHSPATASSWSVGTTRVTNPSSRRLAHVDDVAEVGEVLRLLQADDARQDPGVATVEGEPALGEDLGEPCAVAGDDQIARERHPEPDANRDAVNFRDRGLRQTMQP